MKFTQIPLNTFDELQVGAGILLSKFDPTTGNYEISDILAATDGGVNATAVPSFIDLAEGIDNSLTNMKEGKQVETWECRLSGTFKTVTASTIKLLLGAADIDGEKITIRDQLVDADFIDIWLVADYTRKNSDATGGFIAVHLMNALSTDGLNWQTANKDKGTFSANFLGHASMSKPHDVPFEVYIHEGTDEAASASLKAPAKTTTTKGDNE